MGSSPGPHDRLKGLLAAVEDLRRYAGAVPRERFETSEYKEVFDLLARGGLLPAELSAAMKEWAGFRNVLAHPYTALDLDRLDERRRRCR